MIVHLLSSEFLPHLSDPKYNSLKGFLTFFYIYTCLLLLAWYSWPACPTPTRTKTWWQCSARTILLSLVGIPII